MITIPSKFMIGDQVQIGGDARAKFGVVIGHQKITGHKCPTAEPFETYWPVILEGPDFMAVRVPEIVTLLARR